MVSGSHREEEEEVHFPSSALVVDFTCFVVASWLLQEDLAEYKETCVNYFPGVLQLLLHCKMLTPSGSLCHHQATLDGLCMAGNASLKLVARWVEQEGRKQLWNFVT